MREHMGWVMEWGVRCEGVGMGIRVVTLSRYSKNENENTHYFFLSIRVWFSMPMGSVHPSGGKLVIHWVREHPCKPFQLV
jgi:hypothetical protein